MKIFDLGKPYNKHDFVNYLNNTLLPDFTLEERSTNLDITSIFTQMNYLGTSKGSEIAVFEAICPEKDSKKRIAITQNAFRVLRQHGISNALVAFIYGTEQWRLSLLTSKLELKESKIVSKYSNPRRYSYLLGEGAKTHTPYKYLIDKGGASSLDELKQRFSVEVVNKQFYDEIAKHFTQLVGGERSGERYLGLLNLYGTTKPSVKYQEFAVRLIGRIMFCWFLKEKKSSEGIPLIPEKLLSQNAVKENSDYYHSILEPLFFELLNTRQNRRKGIFKNSDYNEIPYLNGGLFSPQVDDHYKFSGVINGGVPGIVSISDSWFITFFEVLERYSFTVDENTTYDVELSIDPEMLGRIFENLLAEINPETGESAKKSTGSFYTPRDIVDYMVDTSLFHYLKDKTVIDDNKINAVISYEKDDDDENPLSKEERSKIVDALSSLTILDPACGSGAFPIVILQKIVYILQQVDENSKLWVDKQYSSVTSTELRQDIKLRQEKGLFDYNRKIGLIRESIFGVDIQTIATEIAKLRCFLSLMVEETVEDDEPNRGVQPLPNLDFKFISADSLVRMEDSSELSGQLNLFEDQTHIDELKRIRNEYFTADSEERIDLKSEFMVIQKAMLMKTLYNNKQASNRYKLLSEWNPFENKSTTWFDPEWMFGTKKFDIVIANPPYIHLEHIKEKSLYYKTLNFSTYEARGDIYTLFYEKGVQLLNKNGFLCYITSNKWMRSAYGKSLRQFIASLTNPIQLIDFAGQQIFDATVDTNILLLSKSENKLATSAVCVKDKDSITNMSAFIKQNRVTVPFNTSDSWTILSPIEQSIKLKIEAVGTALKDWNIKINRGILTGCNEAFIIPTEKRTEILANCKTEKERELTAEIIQPILRGRDIKRYKYEFADQYLIALLPSMHYNIEDYPAIKDYLLSAQWSDEIPNDHGKEKLEQTGAKHIINGITFTARKKTNNKWFETQDQICYWKDFFEKKIMWKRIGSILCFAYDDEGFLGLDSTCIAVCNNAKFITAYLNSRIGNFLLKDSPKTGTGDLLISVQAIEPILIPKNAESICSSVVNKIIEKAKLGQDFTKEDNGLDELLFSYFSFTEDECDYIRQITDDMPR